MSHLSVNVSKTWWSGNGDFWSDDYRVIYSGVERTGRVGVASYNKQEIESTSYK